MNFRLQILGLVFEMSLWPAERHDEIEKYEEDCFTSSLLSVYE